MGIISGLFCKGDTRSLDYGSSRTGDIMISGLMIQVSGLGVTTLSLMRVEILVRAAAEAGKGLNSSPIMITLPPPIVNSSPAC